MTGWSFFSFAVIVPFASSDDFSFYRECEGYNEEWGACPSLPTCGVCTPRNCVFSPWGEWYATGGCTGLRYRNREVAYHNNECGAACVGAKVESQKSPSGLQDCNDQMECRFSAWQAWTTCSSGYDQATRSRVIEQPAGPDGAPCSGPLTQTKACRGEAPKPCVWTQWQEWTTCSVTCGEGRQTRFRRPASKADPGGESCYGHSLETERCVANPCPRVDCRLSEWSAWSECDELAPQRYRRRNVVEAPSGGGRACDSYLLETVACFAPSTAGENCEVSEWTMWSECSKSCGGGQMFRRRYLAQPNTEGGFCKDYVLHSVQPCMTASCEPPSLYDCQFSQWNEWSQCSANCGKGSRSRLRKVERKATGFGLPCKGVTQELSTCELQTCEVVDCKWGDWMEWSACSASCNGGIHGRTRVVATAPAHGGQSCDAVDKSEVMPCNPVSCDEACLDGQWADWGSWTECSASCDGAFKSRRRDVAVQPSSCGKPAAGEREQFKACKYLPSCIENQDCVLGEWTAWSNCSCHCFGISERNRLIQQYAKGNGRSCTDTLREITPCNPAIGEAPRAECGTGRRRIDCALSDWADWSECSATCGGGQMERLRVMRVQSQNGGLPCTGNLSEALPCNQNSCPQSSCKDCRWSAWGPWDACSKCGGQRFRYRRIQQMPNHCGRLCDPGDAQEASQCTDNCEKDLYCAWTSWSESEACSGCGSSTMTRHRAMGLTPRSRNYLFIANADNLCAGTQLNVSACYQRNSVSCGRCVPKPCIFADWSNWHAPNCLGLCERHRVIGQMNNECGEGCSGPVVETKRCPVVCQPKQDCQLSDWSDWAGCDDTYGKAEQQSRIREIVKMPMSGGAPCTGDLEEIEPCPKVGRDCIWSNWDSWSRCSTKCTVGWHTRQRKVLSEAAHGGAPCAGNTTEVGVCDGEDPNCRRDGKKDCTMEQWSEWSNCGEDGQKTRLRKIIDLPTVYGKPCAGALVETAMCVDGIYDCMLSPWTNWDPCDKTCDGGQTHRHREIHQYPKNGGESCPENLIETRGCNTHSCSGKDCQVGAWRSWGACSATCGVGQQTRSRSITSYRGYDGRGCYEILGEVQACTNIQKCDERDCVWGQWQEWTYCSRSCGGGLRSRKRSILVVPSSNGQPCEPELMEVLEPCHSHKCTDIVIDALWGAWAEWSSCSVSCSSGTTYRTRNVLRPANEFGKAPQGLSFETRICIVSTACIPERDCRFGVWSNWGACSASCDGVRERTRNVAQYGQGHGAFCEGSLAELEPCHGAPPPPVPTTTLPADDKAAPYGQTIKQCLLWGDPHIITFDESQFVFYREGDFWVVQSPEISIQGRFQNTEWTRKNDLTDFSSMTEIVISGSFIGNHKIQVRAFDHGGISCDDREILQLFGQMFCGDVKVTYSDQGKLIDSAMAILPHRVVLITLPTQVTVQVNRFPNFLNARITMPRMRGVDGLCGNMNGYANDEVGKIVHRRFGRGISRSESLFVNEIPLHLPTKLPNPKKCPSERQREGARVCSIELSTSSGWTLAECIGDYCTEGKLRDAKDPDAYNCDSPQLSWSPDYFDYCCRTKGLGCPNMAIIQPPSPPAQIEACSKQQHPVDCWMVEWSQWSQCSARCDGGVQRRARGIMRHAENGGRGCLASTSEVRECNRNPCAGGIYPINCILGDWAQWGACDTCGGERIRYRHILRQAANGGDPCGFQDMQEVGVCERSCKSRSFCGWSEWQAWGRCTQSCGTGGRRKRRRLLHLTDNPNDQIYGRTPLDISTIMENGTLPSAVLQRYESNPEHVEGLHDLLGAFAGGAVSLGLVVLALPFVTASASRWRSSAAAEFSLIAGEEMTDEENHWPASQRGTENSDFL